MSARARRFSLFFRARATELERTRPCERRAGSSIVADLVRSFTKTVNTAAATAAATANTIMRHTASLWALLPSWQARSASSSGAGTDHSANKREPTRRATGRHKRRAIAVRVNPHAACRRAPPSVGRPRPSVRRLSACSRVAAVSISLKHVQACNARVFLDPERLEAPLELSGVHWEPQPAISR